MFVIKRDGSRVPARFDKITERIELLCQRVPKLHKVIPELITQKIVTAVANDMTTAQIDTLAAETAEYMSTDEIEYSKLAARLFVSNLHKQTSKTLLETVQKLRDANRIASSYAEIVHAHHEALEEVIDYHRDYNYTFFGITTLANKYLLTIDKKMAERPQHMIMRIAIQIHGTNIDAVIESYNLMSDGWFTHASPTIFNSGTSCPQLASCFLVKVKSDSIEGIYSTLRDCAVLSKGGGGIGINFNGVRCCGSKINSSDGESEGIVKALKVFNDCADHVNQGSGKRKGSFVIYLEPWHGDIVEFLQLKLGRGHEKKRARDLFYGLWMPDLFMKRVQANGIWSLFDPKTVPLLLTTYGADFESHYETYERADLAIRTMRAIDLWVLIIQMQIETGNPYMLWKDACNEKSNQRHLGLIGCSNLCTEIIEYTAPDEIAVCNLASIALPKFISEAGFDHDKLHTVAKVVCRNLNKCIDAGAYLLPECSKSNLRHRPIGIGVQGLADVYFKLRLPFESTAALELNREIFATIYHGALEASIELAADHGPYETYVGSPASQGLLQYDLWKQMPSKRWDWERLKASMLRVGLRNSLLMAPMPTATTSQILGNTEGIDPLTTNIYVRRVICGDFKVINSYLIVDLQRLGLWSPEMKSEILKAEGSIQNIQGIPDEVKQIYKTAWEISQRAVINQAAARGIYVCQSQSLNLHVANPTYETVSAMHTYAWKMGLKTGMYYLRRKPATAPLQFTTILDEKKVVGPVCTREMIEAGCTECSS